jgi:hypothetical protein
MFERYANGEGCNKIANALNGRGIKRKISQSLWGGNCVRRILANEKYAGDALLQKTYHEGFKVIKNNGEVPQYYVENNHEAIVQRALFEKVQALMEQRKKTAMGSPIKLSPFSGKIKCMDCGKGYMHRKNNRNTPYEKWIWSCYTYIQQGRKYCGGQNIREKDFKEMFLSAYNEAAKFQPHKVKNLDEAIKDLLTQERELVALKVRNYVKPEDYEKQHDELLQQIKETEEELSRQTQRLGGIQEYAAEYSDRLAISLEVAEVSGFTILFRFKNGAEIKRIFNNNTDRRITWARKKEEFHV